MTGVAIMAWVFLGLLYLAVYLAFRQKEVRAAWARREEDEWSWKLLIPRSEQPRMTWAIFGIYGVLAVMWFIDGTLWLAVPSAALCLISFAQGIWGRPPKGAQGGKGVAR